MAGFRLAPVAARRRRNPWQRRRRALGASITQTISVGTAGETDTARPIASPFTQSVGVGTALEVDVAPAVGAASGLFVVHPQGMVPGNAIAAYLRWEWRGPVAAKLNAASMRHPVNAEVPHRE